MKTSRWRDWFLNHFFKFVFAFICLNASLSFAGPARTTYQAKIVKPDGYPLEAANVNFRFTILDPSGTCILYTETYSSVDMSSSSGLISFALGSGVKTYPVSATTFEDVFSNIAPSLSCDAGGPPSYSPAANDVRKIVMQFNDGPGWQTLPAMSINAVPYAMYANNAEKLGGVSATSYVQYSTIPTCTASDTLTYNGTNFSCIAGGGGGSVTSSTVITALGYTPADGVSVTALTSDMSTVSSTVTSVSATVNSLQNSVAASFSAIISSQWSDVASGISYSSGNVGIGTSAPATTLDVSGSVQFAGDILYNNNPSSVFSIKPATARAIGATNPIALYSNINAINDTNGGSYIEVYPDGGAGVNNGGRVNITAYGQGTGANSNAIRFFNRSGVGSVSERMRIHSTGNVGIGTTTPVTKLSVSGGVRISMESATCAVSYAGTLRYNAGAVEFCNGTTWAAFGVSGAGVQSFNGSTSGTQSFANSLTGTTPAFVTANGVHTLNIPYASEAATTAGLISNAEYVNFSNKLNATSAAITVTLGYTPADDAVVGTSFTVQGASLTALTTATEVNAASITALTNSTAASFSAITSSQWTTSGSAIYYSAGKVGIGTTAPTQLLEVYDSTISTGNPTIRINGAAGSNYTGVAGFIGSLDFYNSLGTDLGSAARITAGRGQNTYGSGELHFFTSSSSGTLANRMTIDKSGKVGIGTSAPTSVLSVSGTGYFSGNLGVGTSAPTSTLDVSGTVGIRNSSNGRIVTVDSGNANIQMSGTSDILYLNRFVAASLILNNGGGNVGIGTATPASPLEVNGDITATGGPGALSLKADVNDHTYIQLFARTATPSTRSGFFGYPSSGTLHMNLFNEITSGSLVFGTSGAERLRIDSSGNIGVGYSAPTAKLQLAAGTSLLAPLKFTSGTLLSSPQSGTMEYDGFNFYLTDSGGTRRTIATGSGSGSIDNASVISSSGNMSLVPVGSVIVSATTAATSSDTGALIVNGGLGVAGNMYSSGTIITSSNIQGASITATSGMISPYIAGSIVSGGSLTLDSTTHSSKGNIIVAPNGGNVGIGTANPGSTAVKTFNKVVDLVTTTDNAIQGYSIRNPEGTNNRRVGFFLDDSTGTYGLDSTATTSLAEFVLQVAGAEKVRLTNSGNMGIGVSAPTLPLHVYSAANHVANFDSGYNTAGSGAGIYIRNTASGGVSAGNKRMIYFSANDTTNTIYNTAYIQARAETAAGVGNIPTALDFGTGSSTATTRMTINVSGNVGIGTTNPGGKLHVVGDEIRISGSGIPSGGGADRLAFGSVDGSYKWIQSYGTQPLALNPISNNVGIGTTSPTAKLQISGNGAGTDGLLYLSSTSANADGALVRLGPYAYLNTSANGSSYWNWGSRYDGTTDAWVRTYTSLDSYLPYIRSHVDTITIGGAVSNLTTDSNPTMQDRVTFNLATGNVGIGTAAPTAKLSVSKTVVGADNEIMTLQNAVPWSGTSGYMQQLIWRDHSNIAGAIGMKYNSSGATVDFTINSLYNGGAYQPSSNISFIVRGNGNVGIGTTNPTTKLSVSGGVQISMESAACAVGYAGTLRYDAGNVEFCNGSTWAAFGVAGSGVTSFNGSTSGTQSLAFGTAGTSPGFSTANGVHTLNIPYASEATTTAGLISNTEYASFSNKIASSAASIAEVLGYIPAASGAVSSQWTTSGTEIYYNTGNVGIGTTAPMANLEISASATSGVGGMIQLTNPANLAVGNAVELRMAPSPSAGVRYASIKAINADGSNNIDLAFITGSGASITEKMRVLSSGNVGIGTSSPTSLLEVKTPNAGGSPVLRVSNDGTAAGSPSLSLYRHAGDFGEIKFLPGGGSSAGLVINNGRTTADSGILFQLNGSEKLRLDATGNIGIGITAPTAKLHIASGTSTVAPLKFTSGTLLSSAQPGAMEYDGFNFFITDGASVRRTIATQSSAGVYDSVSAINNSSGNISLTPQSAGSVIVSSTAASTNSSTGALIVNGGMGVVGNIYSSGTIITSSNIQGASLTATSGMITPYIFGSTVSGGSLTLDSTTHGNKGSITIGSSATAVGVGGAPSTTAKLKVSGTIAGNTNVIASGGSVNLALSNIHILQSVGSASIALSNFENGGVYTIIVSDTTARTYTFSGCTNSYFNPTNGSTTDAARTIYGITAINTGGSNYDCYITWSSGFQ